MITSSRTPITILLLIIVVIVLLKYEPRVRIDLKPRSLNDIVFTPRSSRTSDVAA